MFSIEKYKKERSHLFALVLAELLDTNAEVAWDMEGVNENGRRTVKLIHAYVLKDNLILDSIGSRTKMMMIQDFTFKRVSYEKASVKRLYKIIEHGVLDDFKEGEYEAIEQYILANKEIYL